MNPKVSITILNWNGWEDTIECLESLYRITYPNYDAIVVDNGSKDESIEKIKEYAEGKIKVKSKFFEYSDKNKPIKIIEYTREEAEAGGGKEKEIGDSPSNRKLIIIKNEKNYGFAEGNNIAMRYALKVLNPKYVLLLNNDTVVDEGFLTKLVKVVESDEKIGVVGAVNYYYDKPEKVWLAGAKINSWNGKFYSIRVNEIDKGQYNMIKEVDSVPGSCFLIKEEVIEKVGMLNPVYFVHWEDTDWCARIKKGSYKLCYVPKAKIWHKVGSSTKKIKKTARGLYYRNIFWFMQQHATRRQYLLFLLYFFGFKFWFLSGSTLVYYRDMNAFVTFLRGVMDGIKGVQR